MKKAKIAGIIIAFVFIFSGLTYIAIDYFTNNEEANTIPIKKLIKNQSPEEIKKVKEELKKYDMIKRIRDEKGSDRGILEPKANFSKQDRVHYYQDFVTPNHPVIKNYVQSEEIKDINDAYRKAVSWTWVSDETLHNKIEYWLKPKVFLKDTSNKVLYPNNPVDDVASDCESQAYTLVSIIEKIGTSKENVRVVVGNVSFSGEISGHAWVEIYQNNYWYELEATSGPYFDDDTKTLVESSGVGINYFKNNPYPVDEYFAYFNDIYFYNPNTGLSSNNLPEHWM